MKQLSLMPLHQRFTDAVLPVLCTLSVGFAIVLIKERTPDEDRHSFRPGSWQARCAERIPNSFCLHSIGRLYHLRGARLTEQQG